MSKLLKGSIDLTKIEKSAIFNSEKGGKYINVDIWINDDADTYGNHAGIKQSIKEGENDFKSHYIGNAKKGFGWDDNASGSSKTEQTPPKAAPLPESDDLPF